MWSLYSEKKKFEKGKCTTLGRLFFSPVDYGTIPIQLSKV